MDLIVEGDDGVAFAQVDARADHPVHLLLHLRVPALQEGVSVSVSVSVSVTMRVSMRETLCACDMKSE